VSASNLRAEEYLNSLSSQYEDTRLSAYLLATTSTHRKRVSLTMYSYIILTKRISK